MNLYEIINIVSVNTNFLSILSDLAPALSNILFFAIPKQQQQNNAESTDPRQLLRLGKHNWKQLHLFAQVKLVGVNNLEQQQSQLFEFLWERGDEGCDNADEGVCPELLFRRLILSREHRLHIEKQNLSKRAT